MRASALLLPALAVALVAACEGPQVVQPTSDVPEPLFSHGPDGMATATAVLRPVNESGVHGVVAITDDGSSLRVTGLALGLDPGNAVGYGSAFYDLASQLQGPLACEPGKNVGVGTDHPLALSLAQMTIGAFFLQPIWEVDSGGGGGFDPVDSGAYVSVDRIGTVSIRDLRVAGPFGPGTGPAAVVACGKVTAS